MRFTGGPSDLFLTLGHLHMSKSSVEAVMEEIALGVGPRGDCPGIGPRVDGLPWGWDPRVDL